jgi:hypothetical protein
MSKHDKVIRSGPLKGKRIEFTPSTGLAMFSEIAEDFMRRILQFELGDYLITNESSLLDFVGANDLELSAIKKKIQSIYGLDVSDTGSGNLLEIFARIRKLKGELH